MSEHRFIEHRGELELEFEAADEAGIFVAALQAFAELVAPEPEDVSGTTIRHRIDLAGSDRGVMLVDWLNELVYLSEVKQFMPCHVEALELGDDRLRATIAGRRAHPRPLVKAVTFNNLRFEQERGIWHGRVVLDV